MAADWQEFSQKRILEVRQRIQTVVVYEEIANPPESTANAGDRVVQKEAVVDSFDRPLQAQYT